MSSYFNRGLPPKSSIVFQRVSLPKYLSAFFLVVIVAGHAGLALPANPQDAVVSRLTGTPGGNLVVPVTSDVRNFNRLLSVDVASVTVLDRLFSDLVHINRETFELEPSLAWKWDLDRDQRTYTLHLRRDLRFSDGAPFSADDVLFTLQAVQDRKTGSPFTDLLIIDGAFPSCSKIDANTIRIAFPRPVGTGLRPLDSLPILPKHRLEKAFTDGKLATAWTPTTSPSEIVGMGAFRLKEYQAGVKVAMERNPYYWKKDKQGHRLPYLDTITFLVIPDLNAQSLRFQSGEAHLMQSIPPQNFASLRKAEARGEFRLMDLGPGLQMDFLWFNLNPGANRAGKPFVDPEKRSYFVQAEFRSAVSQALDRAAMASALLLGLGSPQFGPVSSGNKVWYETGLPKIAFNPAQAREALQKLGLKDTNGDGVLELPGNRPFEITLLSNRGNSFRERMLQVIRDNLLKIGIRADTQLLEQRELLQRMFRTFEYESVLFGFTPTDLEPDSFTDLWLSSGSNHFWYPNQEKPATTWEKTIDDAIVALVRTVDPARRRRIFNQVQQVWAREMPAIPTVSPNALVAWRTAVGNVRTSILPPHVLWNAEELTLHSR